MSQLIRNNQFKLTHMPTLAALGLVFGDIGTSPLYAFRAAIQSTDGTNSNVLGVLSMIFWSLILVVTIKYVVVILKTDNHGEGGVLALYALLKAPLERKNKFYQKLVLYVCIIGAAMLFGDGVITPAISVLSAAEGMGIWSPQLSDHSVFIAISILILLFSIQRFGALRLGTYFGPVMFVWFTVLGIGGLVAIVNNPMVIQAISPWYLIMVLLNEPVLFITILGAVFLTVTGGEALYADLGQFGRLPISRAWIFIALPALLLNYFGQGAIVLSQPSASSNPFYALFDNAFLLPVTILATLTTIIASQAVISGVFSLSRQAIQLGLLPPMRIRYHSSLSLHDIDLPLVNMILAMFTILMVYSFGSSDSLANAYGIAVAGAMVTTTFLFLAVSRMYITSSRGWFLWLLALIIFVPLDLLFVFVNTKKILAGGLLPVIIAVIVSLVAIAWIVGRGSQRHTSENQTKSPGISTQLLINRALGDDNNLPNIVFLVSPDQYTFRSLNEFTRLIGIKSSSIFLVTVYNVDRPRVADDERVEITESDDRVFRVKINSGYLERTNLPLSLQSKLKQFGYEESTLTYIVDLHRPVFAKSVPGFRHFLLFIYSILAKLAVREIDRYQLPLERTLEIGVPQSLK